MSNIKLSATAICLPLLAFSAPAQAFNLTFDATASTNASVDANGLLGEVYSDAEAGDLINTTDNPDGFQSFFQTEDDPFFLLGAASDTTIPNDDHYVGASVAIFDIEITTENANKDLQFDFDWSFQGNSNGILGVKVDTFTFTVAELSIDPLDALNRTYSNEIDLLIVNEYQEKRNQTLSISGGLPVGTYSLQASVIEPSVNDDYVQTLITEAATAQGLSALEIINLENTIRDTLNNDNSAAGIDNLTINAVPFEFSPTLGLLICGGFWVLSRYYKHKISVKNKV